MWEWAGSYKKRAQCHYKPSRKTGIHLKAYTKWLRISVLFPDEFHLPQNGLKAAGQKRITECVEKKMWRKS